MPIFSMPTLIEGPIEGPVRSRAEWKDRTRYTIINFEIRGKTMEMVGDPLRHRDKDPAPPKFANGDAATVAAYPMGDGMFKVAAMSVPRVNFVYGNSGSGFRINYFFVALVSAFLLWWEQRLALPFESALFFYVGMMITNAVFGCMAIASYRTRRAVQLVRIRSR